MTELIEFVFKNVSSLIRNETGKDERTEISECKVQTPFLEIDK